MVIIALFFSYKNFINLFVQSNDAVTIFILAIGTVIFPIYILQKGIEKSEPLRVSLFLTTIPFFTYLIQYADSRLKLSLFTLLGLSAGVTAMIIGVFGKKGEQSNG